MTDAPVPRAPMPPIRHLVVLGHPAAHSFCRTVVDSYCRTVEESGQEVVLRDLYAMGFDPVLKANERPDVPGFEPAPDVAEELEFVRGCAVVTLVYPIWFGMPPAMIKGYIDRVLGAGFTARQIKQGVDHPLLHGKRMMIFTSSASTRPWLEEHGQWLALRQAFDTYLQTIFSLTHSDHLHFDAIVEGLKKPFVEERLEEVWAATRKLCSELLSERRSEQAHAALERSRA